ncbi:hypothetical protein GC163_01850 [bacterium]|nr:hypothetical protein [bacterium]
MAVITHDAKLNDLLVDLCHSLLQYVAETSPWAKQPETAFTIEKLAVQQQRHISRLVDLLQMRHWTIDFGTYPSDFTDLQYLSVEFFLPRLVAAQSTLVAELDEAVHTCVDDAVAVALLRDILAGEQDILTQLQQLHPQPATVVATS